MSDPELASRTELMILRGDATAPEIHRAATDAMQRGYASLWVGGAWVARVATMLRGSGVATCAAVSYPEGISKSTVKAIEATSAVKDGAEEIAVVPHLPNLLKGDVDAAKLELMEIVRAARAARSDLFVKVIVDANRVHDLSAACRAVRESGCDAIAAALRVQEVASLQRHAEGLRLLAITNEQEAPGLLSAGSDGVVVAASFDAAKDGS
jgi:deoxyribose-phosphate aldolase